MIPSVPSPTSGRCPVCDALTTSGQTICRRCFEPLLPATPPVAVEPATGETSRIYRAHTGSALLVLSASTLEYAAPEIAFHTRWSNVAVLGVVAGEDVLQLHVTPQIDRMPLGNAKSWFSAQTRAIPLGQFGYPANAALWADLRRFAPHIWRTHPLPPAT